MDSIGSNATTIAVGDTYTCRFGHRRDPVGYRVTPARVLQKREEPTEVFLVEELGEDGIPTGVLGCARQEQTAEWVLYSTSERIVGAKFVNLPWTRERAISSLGFAAE